MDFMTLAIAKKYAEQLAYGNIDTEAIITAEVEKAIANLELLKQEDIDNAIAAIEIPSVEGLASTTYVDNAVINSGFAKPEDIDTAMEELKKNKAFDILGEDPNKFSLHVNVADGKSLFEAMAEKGPGLYTTYVQSGVSDNPTGSKSSCRGICCVNTWYNLKEFYGWIILFDSNANCYTRYISVSSGPSEWNNVKQQDLSSYATKEFVEKSISDLDFQPSLNVNAINYDLNVKAINHRGYSAESPENTIPAYIMSKEKGFTYVEADISFTSDGVAVLLHDTTIDRTSNGTGNISSMTYNEVLQYDFGSWFNSKYAGVKIPTFNEFLICCKRLGLHPYIELKSNGNYTQNQITQIVNEVSACGMKNKVTYISFNNTYLTYVKNVDNTARLGLLANPLNTTKINQAIALRTDFNEVFMDAKLSTVTTGLLNSCIANELPLEVWTINDEESILNMPNYISGVTSDQLIAGKVLYNNSLIYTPPEYTYIPATSITLNKTSITFTSLNSTEILTATVEPSNTSDKVIWSSSNSSVASVNLGVVTPKTNGTCIITATAGNYKAECEVIIEIIEEENPPIEDDEETIEPIVNLDLTSIVNNKITNIGTGGSTYDAIISTVNSNDTYTTNENGLMLNNHAYASIPYGFKASDKFTIAVKGSVEHNNTNNFQRMFRTNQDAPSAFYSLGFNAMGAKCAGVSGSSFTVKDDRVFIVNPSNNNSLNTAYIHLDNIDIAEPHSYVITSNGNVISYYLDKKLMATQSATSLKTSTSIGMGDNDASSSYYANSVKISDFKIFNTALTEEQIIELL